MFGSERGGVRMKAYLVIFLVLALATFAAFGRGFLSPLGMSDGGF